MNMVAETAVQGVSDSDCTVRHAVKRCTASTGSRAAEADYWMRQHASYARRGGCCLVMASVLLGVAIACAVSMAPLPFVAIAFLSAMAMAGCGWWCRRNAADAWDLSMWSL